MVSIHPFRSRSTRPPTTAPRTGDAVVRATQPRPRCSNAGFTLIELLIVMFIISVLATMAIPIFTRNVLAAKEAVLREDLQVMRTAIGSYTVDEQKAPQSLEDMVSAGYLKAIPVDPLTGRSDTWETSMSDTLSTTDQTAGGIDDVHSGAQRTALDGSSYNTW